MSQIELKFLGPLTVTIDDEPVTKFRTDKVRALLAILAFDPTITHSRQKLVTLLWPEAAPEQAKANLRVTLSRLRQALQQVSTNQVSTNIDKQLLTVTRQTIQFNHQPPDHTVTVDLIEFQRLLAEVAAHTHQKLVHCASCLVKLEQAASLYQDEFLAGLDVADAPSFEEWLLAQRETFTAQQLESLSQLAAIHEAQRAYPLALKYLFQLLEMNPYHEESHRQCIRLYAYQGQTTQALAHFNRLQQLFVQELGFAPSSETTALVREIQLGTFASPGADETRREQRRFADTQFIADAQFNGASPTVAVPTTTTAAPAFLDVPLLDRFYGRAEETAQLTGWLSNDGCRLVTIAGMGGMGKSTLAAHLVRHMATQVDQIIWRSLLNAPPVDDFLPALLQTFVGDSSPLIPDSLDQQLALALHHLRERRVLLVLDNLESILSEREPGTYLRGYEPYGQLLELVATREHQSQIIITSRERPPKVGRWERDTPQVRSLKLSGLDQDAGRELLAGRGVVGSVGQEHELIARYSGNPLALKLVADTVDDLYQGDIDGFLADETMIFDDIRTVLDHQFARLSALERELLLWLAIAREPTSMVQLRDDLLHPPLQRALVEALRSLQRRSLVEPQETLFALQNVVTEYLTARLVEKAADELVHGELDWLHSHALIKAQSKEYVRQSQERLILHPVLNQLAARLDGHAIQGQLRQILTQLQSSSNHKRSYGTGNLLNLFRHLNIDISGYDFSHLNIWQANLRGWTLRDVDFRGAHFATSLFTASFSTPRAVALHPAGERLAVGTESGEIRLWTVPGTQPTQVLRGHTQRVSSVVFHPDGERLVSTSLDDTIRLWNLQAGELLHTLQLPRWGGGVLAMGPDGRLLASGGRNGLIYLWDVETGQKIHQIESQVRWVYALAFSPQGNLLAGSGRPKFVHLWDLSFLTQAPCAQSSQAAASHSQDKPQSNPIVTLQTKHAPVPALAFSPDGRFLASGSGGYVTEAWDLSDLSSVDEQPKWSFDGDGSWVNALAITPDGNTIASGTNEGIIFLANLQDGRRLERLTGHNHHIYSLAFDPTGKTLVSASEDNTVRMWACTDNGQWQLSSILQSHMPGSNAIAFSPDGTTLAVGDTTGIIHLWHGDHTNVAACQYQALSGHTNSIRSIAYHPNGRFLATSSIDKTLRIWDLHSPKDGTPRCINLVIAGTEQPHVVGFTRAGNQLYGCSQEGKIRIWQFDEEGQTTPYRILQRDPVATVAVAIHPQGNDLAEANYAGAPHLWDITEGKHHMELSELRDVTSLIFQPNGDVVAAGSRSGCIGLWEMASMKKGKLRGISPSCESPIGQIAFAPNGDLVAGACEDGAIRLWSLEALDRYRSLAGHTGSAAAVAFHPNGGVLASGGSDGTVKLWDVATGDGIATLALPRPYEGMNITNSTGISDAQRSTLRALGAVED